MPTKFILHGGFADHVNEKNDKFFQEILSIDKNNLKILLTYFAKDFSKYKELKEKSVNQFERNGNKKDLDFIIADEDKFIEQVKEADIVYLHGGKTLKLLEALKKYDNLKELLRDKIVAGESAGAYVLSTCFYTKSEGNLFQGLGFAPVKTICHYEGKNQEKLKECPGELEELLLSDYEYKVFEL
jgi:peptidase E